MANTDFADIATPLLSQLQDDPDQGAPEPFETTTFPEGGGELNGQAVRVDETEGVLPVGSAAPLAAEDVEAAQRAYPTVGIDVLAFYKSFRFRDEPPFRGMWGIFLLDAGVEGFALDFHSITPTLAMDELRVLATDVLVAHEQYHFWIDAWALGQEVLPLAAPRLKRYVYYLGRKAAISLTEYDLEESLANHYAFRQLRGRRLSDGSTAARVLRKAFSSCPIPYSDFAFNMRERAHREGGLAIAVANGQDSRAALLFDAQGGDRGLLSPGIRPTSASHAIVSSRRCPKYRVTTVGYARAIQPLQGPPLKDFERFLENYLDGKVQRETDHRWYRIDNGQKIKVPNPHRKELLGREFIPSLHKAGMTHRDFRNERVATAGWKKNCPRTEVKPPIGS